MNKDKQLAILAGRGLIPVKVADSAQKSGWKVFIVSLNGEADKALDKYPNIKINLTEVTKIIRTLKNKNIKDILMIGYVDRPYKWKRDIGLSLLLWAIKNRDFFRRGDASMCSKVVDFLEKKDFVVHGTHEIASELVLQESIISNVAPNKNNEKDIEYGFSVARMLGNLDIGQGIVVEDRRVLAIEAAEGTDMMLERVVAIKNRKKKSINGVFIKCLQEVQDNRIDMPTIGPVTIQKVYEAGLNGIAISAGGVIVYDYIEVCRLLNEYNIFLVARPFNCP
ncbi:UDP-2,3-diacylglucosamine diphosphatase LpxI [Hyphomicrobiales bacterium]|jgi:DUF1009 family protein|nr:UDP-2,3-diacylglucosamine diphosphatase LpxI [Rhodobiaceae bacterium]MBT6222966.1 UDP-2,3-diacylglucosamine diphosphatase LpxI [Rhodobiaceae bacterium]MDB4127938.1 UDP-2,3-diacylglucosamine diphosphatase LpxI [Hyphomicrobiales bacterium]